jgi:hypothetical protein
MYDNSSHADEYCSGIEQFVALFSPLYSFHAFPMHLLGHLFKAFLFSLGLSPGFNPIDPFLRVVNYYKCYQ